jgi:hypothetical protein
MFSVENPESAGRRDGSEHDLAVDLAITFLIENGENLPDRFAEVELGVQVAA